MTSSDAAAEAQAACGPDAVVEGAGTVEMVLPAVSQSVGIARRYVHRRWRQLDDGVLNDVGLIVSELVSNAVRHGQPDIVFRLRVDPLAVDVAVLDQGPDLPPTDLRPAGGLATSGRGLSIVNELASSWGVDGHDGSGAKTVWASIQR